MTSLLNTFAGSRPGYTNSIIIGVFTVSERKCIVIEIGWSLGILYSENRTLGIKDYTERVSKHDDAFFNFIFILLIAVSTDWS